jgi:hypothetical protein
MKNISHYNLRIILLVFALLLFASCSEKTEDDQIRFITINKGTCCS